MKATTKALTATLALSVFTPHMVKGQSLEEKWALKPPVTPAIQLTFNWVAPGSQTTPYSNPAIIVQSQNIGARMSGTQVGTSTVQIPLSTADLTPITNPFVSLKGDVWANHGRATAAGNTPTIDFETAPRSNHSQFDVWIRPSYAIDTQKYRAGFDGYNGKTKCVSLGADDVFSDVWKGGVAVNFTHYDVKMHNYNDGRYKTNSFVGSAYLSWSEKGHVGAHKDPHWFVDGLVSAGSDHYRTHRPDSTGLDITSNFKAIPLMAEIKTGKHMHFHHQWKVSPMVSLSVNQDKQASRQETGSTQAIYTQGQIINSQKLGIGAKLSHHLKFENHELHPMLMVMYKRDLTNSSQNGVSVANGTTLVTPALPPTYNQLEVNTGIAVRIKKQTMLSLDYALTARAKFTEHQVKLKYSYKF